MVGSSQQNQVLTVDVGSSIWACASLACAWWFKPPDVGIGQEIVSNLAQTALVQHVLDEAS